MGTSTGGRTNTGERKNYLKNYFDVVSIKDIVLMRSDLRKAFSTKGKSIGSQAALGLASEDFHP